MSVVEIVQYFDSGEVVRENYTAVYCESWLLLPAENIWPRWIRIILYLLGLAYCFIGVAIGSDVFMTSIEVITSKKRTIVVSDEEGGAPKQQEVLIWNETVANLTLLALGSSAPEILLAVIEAINDLINNREQSSSLGFYTIIGSAAFNLLLITGICIVSIPSPDYKKIEQFGVFVVTSISSLLAYIWLLVVLLWISPGVVDPWEAWVTFIFFPFLVITAYATDNGWWTHKWLDKWLRFLRPRTVRDQRDDIEKPVVNGLRNRSNSIAERAIPLSPERRRKLHRVKTSNIATKKEEILAQYQQSPPEQRQVPVRQPFARARFRHAAIRSLGGIRRIPLKITQTDAYSNSNPNTPKTEPKFLSVISKLAATRGLNSNSNAFRDKSSASLMFASASYSVLESAGELKITVLLNRRKRAVGEAIIPTTTTEGKFDTQLVSGVISVDYETREGTAKINKDFKYSSGTLIFTENDFAQEIAIPIINDNQYNPDTDFYVILKNPSGDATLGDPSVSRVTIIDDDKPGDFELEKSQFYADMENGVVHANVLRQNGCDGDVKVHFATIDGTAKGGDAQDEDADYTITSGVLRFKHQETSQIITVPVNANQKEVKNFVIVLRNPTQGSNLGEHSAAVANINLQPGGMTGLSRVLIEENDTSYFAQFRRAMHVGGEIDEDGNESVPTKMSYFLHFLSMPWKVLFAFTPTRNTYGGFPAFFCSMFLIGGITAIIEQFGNLLGCTAGLMQQVTGVTFIAIGTSLPDTIASRTAALQDDTADAAIGNVTGSNSVNVFLGLGLPWVIRTCYHLARGTSYMVNTEGLVFSVVLFDSLGCVCVIALMLRRFYLGGELGGKMLAKWLSGGFLFVLWVIFVTVSSINSQAPFFP